MNNQKTQIIYDSPQVGWSTGGMASSSTYSGRLPFKRPAVPNASKTTFFTDRNDISSLHYPATPPHDLTTNIIHDYFPVTSPVRRIRNRRTCEEIPYVPVYKPNQNIDNIIEDPVENTDLDYMESRECPKTPIKVPCDPTERDLRLLQARRDAYINRSNFNQRCTAPSLLNLLRTRRE